MGNKGGIRGFSFPLHFLFDPDSASQGLWERRSKLNKEQKKDR